MNRGTPEREPTYSLRRQSAVQVITTATLKTGAHR